LKNALYCLYFKPLETVNKRKIFLRITKIKPIFFEEDGRRKSEVGSWRISDFGM